MHNESGVNSNPEEINQFERPVPRCPSPDNYKTNINPAKPEGLEEHQYYPQFSQKDADRLLGLDRKYQGFTDESLRQYLPSEERRSAYERIETSTLPKKRKIEQKKNIVAEVLQNVLIPEEILKEKSTVYLGSGTDIEYPLALGARNIEMVDYIFEDERAKEEVIARLNAVNVRNIRISNGGIKFDFDFGQGLELVSVALEPKAFDPHGDVMLAKIDPYLPPEEIGLIMCFAAQGPAGTIDLNDDIKSKLAPGGIMLIDENLIRINKETGEETKTRLGTPLE